MLVGGYAYIREHGGKGLQQATQMAVLNANYIRGRLEGTYHVPYGKPVMHECVLSDRLQNAAGVKTLDIAKRLIDYGFHPPTIYFPLIVSGAIMIEPTETLGKEVCDQFCDAMIAIARECETSPELVKSAPTRTYRRRLNEVKAAKEPKLTA